MKTPGVISEAVMRKLETSIVTDHYMAKARTTETVIRGEYRASVARTPQQKDNLRIRL
jgi:hypothetical protein